MRLIPRARCARVVAQHGLQRVDIIDHADVIDPDDCRTALGDETLCASSQSLVAALKSRAVILVLSFGCIGRRSAVKEQ
jgi:hypothetical protein